MSEESRRPFVWLRELLEDPSMLEPPRAIVPRLVYEKRVTLLAAREKTGKSTLAGAAAAAISSGTPFLGSPCTQGNVLIVSLEEHPQEFVQRLVRFGADPDHVAVVTGDGNLLSLVHEAAKEVHPALIIWDTLGAAVNKISGSKTIESGDAQAWIRILMEMLEISRDYGAALLLHHSRKSDGRYRDSSAIGGAVDIVMEMHGEGAEPRTIKNNSRLTIPETRFTLEATGLRLLETQAELQERVLDFVAKNPRCSMRDIYDGVGGRDADLTKARDELVKKGAIANVGGKKHEWMAVK